MCIYVCIYILFFTLCSIWSQLYFKELFRITIILWSLLECCNCLEIGDATFLGQVLIYSQLFLTISDLLLIYRESIGIWMLAGPNRIIYNTSCYLFYLFLLLFLGGLHLQHIEVPRLGVELELQLLACATQLFYTLNSKRIFEVNMDMNNYDKFYDRTNDLCTVLIKLKISSFKDHCQ